MSATKNTSEVKRAADPKRKAPKGAARSERN